MIATRAKNCNMTILSFLFGVLKALINVAMKTGRRIGSRKHTERQ
jgi:hypothetical protein